MATAAFRAATSLALTAAVVLAAAEAGWAGNVYVNPIRIVLGGAARTAALTVRNTSTGELRMQLAVFGWDQDTAGQLILTPTQDIIFFPRLFTLAAGEQRLVRIGISLPAAAVERTYRIFVEELPPLETAAASTSPGQIRVLARLGVPIFAPPVRGRSEPRVTALAIAGGRITFELRNAGTVHLAPDAVRVRGYDASGLVAWERELEGWYVLARGARRYALEVDRDECRRTTAVGVDVRAQARAVTERLDLPPEACGR